MVNQAIAMLNPDDAEIITLFYKSEQSLEEISQVLGVKSILQRFGYTGPEQD
jgi:RNA polymerase sigma-70 factor (ECF subfamily)